MSPGKILYQLYYRPVGNVRNLLKTGLRRTVEIRRGKLAMIKASKGLHEIVYEGPGRFNVYFLTGKKYWFQTAFCLFSLQRVSGVNIHAYAIDDGTFDHQLEQDVNKQFPTTVTIVRSTQLQRLLDQNIPEKTYPVLRKRRIEYPHLRKLTDVHVLPGEGPKLVLDSDMLFFRKPTELLNWLKNPEEMLFMRDVEESYGYTKELMQDLTATELFPERLNVGVAGIASREINWAELELWTDTLLKKEGSSYLQEQALTAMIAAKQRHKFLSENQYRVLPTISEPSVPETLHHYVANSKYDYFVKGWKLVTQQSK